MHASLSASLLAKMYLGVLLTAATVQADEMETTQEQLELDLAAAVHETETTREKFENEVSPAFFS